MKIILNEKIDKLGMLGDIVSVKRGFARNYLIPYGKAIKLNKKNIITFDKVKIKKKNIFNTNQAKFKAKQILGKKFEIFIESDENGRLFSSITKKDISDLLENKEKIKIDHKNIKIIKNNIKYIGLYKVIITLYNNIKTKVEIAVRYKNK